MRSVLLAPAVAVMINSSVSNADPASDFSASETRLITYDYAQCVIGSRRNAIAASEALLNNADNRTIMSKYSSLINGNCLTNIVHSGVRMKFPLDLYGYALADALVGRELAAMPIPDLSGVPRLKRSALPEPPVALPVDAPKSDKARHDEALEEFNAASSMEALSKYGECVVRNNPVGAKALLLTRPETPAEFSSFSALGTALAQCLPSGITVSFGKVVLRGTIAVNFYRLVQAARPVPVR